MADKTPTTADEMRALRKRRNLWVVGLIFWLAVLFYLITIFKMVI